MNLPNKLTLMRILMIPAIVVVAYIPYLIENYIFYNISIANFLMAILFMVASFTDFLDGHIARKNDLVTTFGKFADPLADKLLVMAAMLILVQQEIIPAWIVIIILAREFIVTGIRLVVAKEGVVIAAGKIGKVKTATTMIAIIFLFFHNTIGNVSPWTLSEPVFLTGTVLIYIATLLTIISGVEYTWKSRKYIFESI